MNAVQRRRPSWPFSTALLRAALRRHELFLLYQPITDLDTGQWVGAEALVRWRHPSGEIVGPDAFLPAVAQYGLNRWLSRHVVELVAPDLSAIAAAHPDFFVSLNLTADDPTTPDTIGLVQRLIAGTGLRPDRLMLEVTEHGDLNPDRCRAVIAGLRELGVAVAIDDFGTGYCNLLYLQALDVDVLKIDKSFVATLSSDVPAKIVVSHIIALAQALELQIIAEGVEDQPQAASLRQRGVRLAQGWLFSPAIPVEDLLDGLARPSSPPTAGADIARADIAKPRGPDTPRTATPC